jgi:uncharacterized membrane protein
MLFKNVVTFLKNMFEKPHAVFLFLILIFGVPSAFMVPQLSVNDEGAHFYRSYDLANGDIKNIDNKSCSYPDSIVQKISNSNRGEYHTDYRAEDLSSNNVEVKCTGASAYSIIMHLPQAIGIASAKFIDSTSSSSLMVLFGRLN